MSHTTRPLLGLLLLSVAVAPAAARADTAVTTPPELVQTYDKLADGILALKQTEWHAVHAILATTYGHAVAAKAEALAAMKAGRAPRAEVEKLAALVAQLGNEGDAAVAAVRKRLIDGGHHHHASDDTAQYDPGFVIVTRKAKQTFLDAAGKIARLGPDGAGALEGEWKRVEQTYRGLLNQGGM